MSQMSSDSPQRSQGPLRLILMGTGPFAVPTFEALRAAGHDIPLVVTRPLRAVKSRRGAPSAPVRDWALEHGLTLIDPPSINDPEVIATLAAHRPDLLVVCDYGQILKPAALETAELGGINLHGSLLPKYRGAAPVQWAVLNGDPRTGVSVIHMTPRLDAGPILATRETEIGESETAGELEDRLAELGVDATLEAVEQLRHWDGQSPIGQTQDASLATKAPRLSKVDGQIDWTRTAKEIDCQVRGTQPWPGAYTFIPQGNRKPPLRLAVKQVRILDEPVSQFAPSEIVPGQIVPGPGLRVAASDGVVELSIVQPSGKREMTGEEFLRGRPISPGTVLGNPSA